MIPRRVVRRFNELTREEVNDLFENVQKIGVILERLHGATSLTVSMQDGPDAGQTVHVSSRS